MGRDGENRRQTTDKQTAARLQKEKEQTDTQTLTVTFGSSNRLTPHVSCAALRSALKHLRF